MEKTNLTYKDLERINLYVAYALQRYDMQIGWHTIATPFKTLGEAVCCALTCTEDESLRICSVVLDKEYENEHWCSELFRVSCDQSDGSFGIKFTPMGLCLKGENNEYDK